MDEEEIKLLEKTYNLAKENNKILKELRAAKRRAAMMRLIYWLVIIILALAAYYYIEPYVDQLMELYDQSSGLMEEVQEVRDRLPLGGDAEE